ncbi:sodium:proton antiporter NhaD [Pollutibacter soli]|uniref:sodium:proton antiporter NhaD n=1 Tax=Pollutibacter soli TaxID=3034157 RepID=UPI0030136FC5
MEQLITIVFILGYLAIAGEHFIKINKAASALITGVLCWTIYILSANDVHLVNEQLLEHLGDVAGILFFLLGAMTIVELIDAHDGFQVISEKIKTTNKRTLLWIVGFLAFFLSAILDNLTTTIVMITLSGKLIDSRENRLFFAGMIVIAANAGGAWSPIGDVTTTMLWIGGQITSVKVVFSVLLPSLVCLLVPLIMTSRKVKGHVTPTATDPDEIAAMAPSSHRNLVMISGVAALLFVPAFKTFTHLPPFMGMLISLGVMWIVTEMIHHGRDEADKHKLSVNFALKKIDTPSILFFLGILLSVGALQSIGLLTRAAGFLSDAIGNENLIVVSIGLLSSIVDNVPLVAASQGMYSLAQYPTDDSFWHFMAYCTGTGGSVLIIGSAAGVAAMGIEKIEFFWYLKKISILALCGYLAGAGFFILQKMILN